MLNKRPTVFIVVLLIISGIALFVINQAPQTSSIQVTGCLQSTGGNCLHFPTVSGENLNGATVTFPDDFAGEYNLVIVPFDREQQEAIVDWLPFVQTLKADYDGLEYYSIAALPDVSAPVRLLISGGMRLAIDDDLKEVVALLYLDDQQAFADALAVASLEETQLFILDQNGDVIWHTSGGYSASHADTVREQITLLPFSS